MKIQKKNLQQYNHRDTLLVISTYPKKGEVYSKDVDAVAPYTKNTLLGIKKQRPEKKIVVLAPVIYPHESYSKYTDDGILVIRCFKRNDIFLLLNIMKQVMQFTQISSVLVEFEFSTFGDTKVTLSLPLLLMALALVGKKITLVLHQVVLNLETLSGHIGVRGIKTKIMSWVLRQYYEVLCAPVKNVIVLEDEIKNRLSSLINQKKIYVLYHGVDTTNSIKNFSQEQARKILGIQEDEFVLVYFGYMTWYKGADFLVKVLKDQKQIGNKRLHVIMAGGPSVTQNHKKHYKKFFTSIESLVKNTTNISLTGFVNEEQLSLYFSASDLVVFPYRTFMSSSGALATAFRFGKPFIVSSKLNNYFKSSDIVLLLRELGISFKDISFALDKKSLIRTIYKSKQKNMLGKLTSLSVRIKQERNFVQLAKQYSQLLFTEKYITTVRKKRFTFSLPRLQLSYGEN